MSRFGVVNTYKQCIDVARATVQKQDATRKEALEILLATKVEAAAAAALAGTQALSLKDTLG